MRLTTRQLADKEGVKVKTIWQWHWRVGYFRGYTVVGYEGRQYLWEKL